MTLSARFSPDRRDFVTSRILRLAMAALTLAFASVILAAVSGFGHRLGWWAFSTGFVILRWAAYLAAVAVALVLATLVLAIARTEWRAFAVAVLGLGVSLPVVIVPLHLFYLAHSLPPIHDITTDTHNPPAFVALLPLRRGTPNPSAYGGAQIAAMQERAYPDIRPEFLSVAPADAFRRALDIARSLGWRIVAIVPQAGRIEATDTTFWFGFTDDIVVRVQPTASGARVDLRSVSRVGRSDIGANAHRIRMFLAAFRSRV